MSAHNKGSGPRSNMYSEDRFTNWAEYEPWGLEVQAVFKRFDSKIAKYPDFPKIIELPVLEGFIHPCSARQVEAQLRSAPEEFLQDLRAVFILSGTRKQLNCSSSVPFYYGHYWRRCIFLHPYPSGHGNLDWLRHYYLRNVLMHELGHHVDKASRDRKEREKFADKFAETYGGITEQEFFLKRDWHGWA